MAPQHWLVPSRTTTAALMMHTAHVMRIAFDTTTTAAAAAAAAAAAEQAAWCGG
jgi:hypothetical protein